MFTKEESRLLERMANGELDGYAGDWDAGKSRYVRMIKNGTPMVVRQGPGQRIFNGKENEWYEGKREVHEEWITDAQKIEFLRKYGWLMEDPEVTEYSAKFKP